MLEAFIAELEGEEEARKISNLLDSANSVEPMATYRLDHPYEGENFWKYSLPENERVSARVDLEVVVDGEEVNYSGRVYDNAYDIFNPPDPAESEEVDSNDGCLSSELMHQEESSGQATIETD